MTDAELPPEAVAWLQSERLVVLASASRDGDPASHVVSWALAVDARTVRLAVRHAAPAVEHVRATGRLALEILDDGMAIGMRGSARLVREYMDSTPRGNAMIGVRGRGGGPPPAAPDGAAGPLLGSARAR